MSEATGPVRWRVDIAGCEPDLYSDRRKAVAAARLARLKGYVVTLTRVETVSRRWLVNGVRCYVKRTSSVAGWRWGVCGSDAGLRLTYLEAVEAAERAARGQR